MSTLSINVDNSKFNFCKMVVKYSGRMNLVSRKNVENLVHRLFEESVIALNWNLCNLASPFLDVGSGAGFPGIPLKIDQPSLSVVLLDSNKKKCSFLKLAIRNLSLKNINVVNMRAEEYVDIVEHKSSFGTIVSRGVGNLRMLLRISSSLLIPGGELILWKGSNLSSELSDVDLSDWRQPDFWHLDSGLTLVRFKLAR